tara:strand:- start:357 stop:794 length:438 start_codon:yes stop_codon:yes gene_type:complete
MTKNLLSMDQLNKVTKREQAVSPRFAELQNEITRLQAIDKATSERVAAEFLERDIAEYHKALGAEPPTMGSFDENGDALEFNSTHTLYIDENGESMEFLNSGGDPLELNQSFVSAWTQEDCNEFIEVGCSLQLDMEMANESENIQ